MTSPVTALKRCSALALSLMLIACGGSSSRPNPPPATPEPPLPALDIYGAPPLTVRQILLAENEEGNPKEIRLFIPEQDGEYPLLQFQHGFVSDVDTYTNLLAKLAGFGFVVAGPQMYVGDPSTAPTIAQETDDGAAVLTWLHTNLNTVLAARLQPELTVTISVSDTGLLGHSRGGQVAWRLLFDEQVSARAIAGVDPVDGDAPPFPPGETGELVTDDPGAFQFPFASLIIGMGLGSEGAPGFECAPENRNYRLFYDASAPPRYEVVATDYGHSDMLNGDEPAGACAGAIDGTREQVRLFTAGQLAAYFRSVLSGEDRFDKLRDLRDAPVSASGRFEE